MSFFARAGLDRFNPAQRGAAGMKLVAGGLLLAMAALYLAARLLEPRHAGWGFARAFAEAGMVGGVADWFAVTALFRHPFGLPIPHTAIIPRNKDRIGDTLAVFLKQNFLTPRVVARRMRRIDVAGAIGRFLAAPPEARGRIGEGAFRLAVGLLESLDPEKLGGLARGAIAQQLRQARIAPLMGQALDAAIADGRHLPLVDAMVRWLGKTLQANDAVLRELVSKRAGSILRWTGLDEKLADAILSGLNKLVDEVAADPQHPLRERAEESLAGLAVDLQHDPVVQARVEGFKEQLLDDPAVARWWQGVWEQLRGNLLRLARDPQRAMAGRLGETVRQLGTALQSDPRLGRSINGFARRATVGAVAAYGDGIVSLVSGTIRGWDARTVTGRLEAAVGKDLQYIRVNGTLVGGLVGVLIHLVDAVAR